MEPAANLCLQANALHGVQQARDQGRQDAVVDILDDGVCARVGVGTMGE
jgi:uncharacterized protein YuzB (UPF0349 family)